MCPELMYRLNAIRRAADLMMAEECTMVGFLPPSSSTAGGEVPGGCLVHDLADPRAAETLAYGLLLATTACLEPALA